MSEARSMSIKAFLTLPDGSQEVRRFGIPEGASTSFSYLQERVRDVFCLGIKMFKIHWQDSEGDYILISSDEELFEAIADNTTNQGQQLLRIYVTSAESKNENKEKESFHMGVICDGCDGNIYGTRYKCKSCPDFDLCSSCVNKGIHKHHQFLKLAAPAFGFTVNAHAEGFPDYRGCKWDRHRSRENRRWTQPPPQPQQQQQQQQQQFFGSGFGFNTGSRDDTRQRPFEFSFSNSTAGGIPVMGFGFVPPNPDVLFPGTEKLAEEAGKFASEMASKHVADIMKGIWTAWSGNQTAPNQPPSSDSSTNTSIPKDTETRKTPEKTADGNSGVINIDISLDEDETSGSKNKGSSKEQEEAAMPEIVLMETDEPSQTPSGQSTPSGIEEWTVLNKEKDSSADTARSKSPQTSTDATAPQLPNEQQAPQPLYPSIPPITQPPHANERVRKALEQMQAMGYSDEGGWLTRLLEMKDGDINKVLDILLVQRK